jgi:predicted metal-dependent peptidase
MRELIAIEASHPQTQLVLYFADVDIYGPVSIDGVSESLPAPVGGGGTSFQPFFDKVATEQMNPYDGIIYLTDGFADFPRQTPSTPVLWVLTEDGEEENNIPFGKVVRITRETA